jgi:hypothetical protein
LQKREGSLVFRVVADPAGMCHRHGFVRLRAAGQWTEQRAGEWYEKQPWLFGFNFVPSTAVNDTEMWQKETFDRAVIERELASAEQLGYNSCRVFVQYIVWKADPKGLKNRFGQLLEIAHKHNISVIPVLFDDCAFDGNRDPCRLDSKKREEPDFKAEHGFRQGITMQERWIAGLAV